MDPQVGSTAGQAPAQPSSESQALPAPASPPAASSTTSTDTDRGEDYDLERARATISKLREIEKAAKAQAKELEAFKAAQREREEAELSQQDKLAKRAEHAEQEVASYKTRLADMAFRSAVTDHATRLGFVDTDAAARLLEPADVQREDDGAPEPRSLKAALERMAKARPWLLNQEAARQQAETQRQEAQRNSRGLPTTPPARTSTEIDGVATARDRLVSTGEYRRL